MNKQETKKIDNLLKLLFDKGYDPEDKKSFNHMSVDRNQIKEELFLSDAEIDRFIQIMFNRRKGDLKFIGINKERYFLHDLGIEFYYSGGFEKERREEQNEKFWNFITNRLIIILSFFLSIGAIAFSYWTYQNSFKEELLVYIDKMNGNHEVELYDFRNYPYLDHWFSCAIINNSEKPVSIVDFEVVDIENPAQLRNSEMGIYKDMKTKMSFPIELEVGKSQKFFIKYAIGIDNEIGKKLKSKYENLKKINFRDAINFLHRDSTDLFGNKITPTIIDNQMIGFTMESFDNKSANLSVTFLTSRGNTINEKYSYYPKFE